MCAHPGCRPSKETFQFVRGPAGAPPKSGWALKKLPVSQEALQNAWQQFSTPANGPNDALWQAVEFLAANGIKGPEIMEALDEAAVFQWCSPEPWRCGRGRLKKKAPYLPWAKALWEESNRLLVATDDPKGTLDGIILKLTKMIEGPEGCSKCARRWRAYLILNPPEIHNLEDARRWLWAAHNHSRQNQAPVPYRDIAEKFNWN